MTSQSGQAVAKTPLPPPTLKIIFTYLEESREQPWQLVWCLKVKHMLNNFLPCKTPTKTSKFGECPALYDDRIFVISYKFRRITKLDFLADFD